VNTALARVETCKLALAFGSDRDGEIVAAVPCCALALMGEVRA
jgi:hypothetical protein